MIRKSITAVLGLMFAAAPAFALNPVSQSTLNKRQIIDCMTKKMAASKLISYNEAAKLCKDQMKLQNDKLTLNNDANPGIPSRR